MSKLINKFRQDLRMAGYRPRSIQVYIPTVLRLQRFCNKPVEEILEEDLIAYWDSCTEECGWATSTMRISYSGIKRFFRHTLVRDWKIFDRIHLKRKETLPTILSCTETKRIIDALPTLQSRTFYTSLYSMGLRLNEAMTLRPRDILSDRGLVHIHEGKGARDRVPVRVVPDGAHRSLQHVLPVGFMKVRHYGLLNPNFSLSLEKIRNLVCAFYNVLCDTLPLPTSCMPTRPRCPRCKAVMELVCFFAPVGLEVPSG